MMPTENGQSCEFLLDAYGDALSEKTVAHIGCKESGVAYHIRTSSADPSVVFFYKSARNYLCI